MDKHTKHQIKQAHQHQQKAVESLSVLYLYLNNLVKCRPIIRWLITTERRSLAST
ncbi:hypothetical protein L873DRAFT_1814906 [Choiromyces venosus 120613-1]|uniref:Uncharacterized protein n=1 Tax=Choiromyces venosus 120613-1 TaxID=1336337 RepID=A0A3N4J7J9_9PEZI|nr:hypothetical protein L873DRAFT_1814906 [Choiromyces venosus 120613-1]